MNATEEPNEFIPKVELSARKCSLLHALPVHPSTDATRGVHLTVGGDVLADSLEADGALLPGAGRLGRRHRFLRRPVREAERRELAIVLLQAFVGLPARQVVALLALLTRATHRRALPLAKDALEASAPLHLRPDLRRQEAAESVVLVVPALPQPGGEEEAEVMRAHPVRLEQVVVASEVRSKLAAQEARSAVGRSRAAFRSGVALYETGTSAHSGPLPGRSAEGETHRCSGRPRLRHRLVLLAGRRGGHHTRVGVGKVTHESALPSPRRLPIS